ncbi:MAG: type 4a pilus biogenesis protein PilO [Burkholderiaceae bacterium]|jgi:type IV pilus assembly protein PilO|nr:type 4a pilus biogenesis protein PilO [Burkholderiaceae bacterium]
MGTKAKFWANIDFPAAARDLTTQFRELDTRDPSSWPNAPKYILHLFVTGLSAFFCWQFWVSNSANELQVERDAEERLRSDYKIKVQRAVSLDALKKQRVQVLQYVNVLEKQLPSKSEMDALLSDINQAGLGRSLQFDLFRPGQVVIKDYYAELPIALKVTGRFHDIGAFTADVASLSRIVTLNNIFVSRPVDEKSGALVLVMEATAKTFRYLDAGEQAEQQAAKNKNQRGGGK